jgi:uncharacterized protein (TIGR00725 family)
MSRPVQVTVCGPRDCTDEEWVDAHEVGALLATRGAVVVCGGLSGVMAAVAAGVRSAGGTVIGLLPGTDRAEAGPDLTAAIPTGLGEARNALVVNSGDAVIVVGGSWGTVSEVALAMRRGDVPVVQLGGWRVIDEGDRPVPGIVHAKSPAEAVAATGLWEQD